MAVIGKVSSLVGTAVATDSNGNQRVLSIGDEIFDGEVVTASAGSKIELQMTTGDIVEIADGQAWTPTSETFSTADNVVIEDQIVSPSDLASLESIQQALLSGQDPTELGEATAAGATAAGSFGGADGDGGSSFVRTLRTGAEIDPSAGYNTIGTSANITGPVIHTQLFPQPLVSSITLAATAGAVVEGNELVFTISLDSIPVISVDFSFTIGGGTASVFDYTQLTFSSGVINNGDGTITVPEGVDSFTAALPTIDDSEDEFTETVPFTVGGVSITGLILDNDEPVISIEATQAVAVEGMAGSLVEFTVSQDIPGVLTSTVLFRLNLDQISISDISEITYSDAFGNIVNVTDIADFLANGVLLTIPANSTVKPVVTITPVNDDTYEKSEAFSATISTPVNANLGTGTANAKIVDETTPGEPPEEGDKPTVNLVATHDTAVEGEAGSAVEFEVSQTNQSNFATSVQFKLDLGELEIADIASITYTDATGATITVTDIADFVANGVLLTIPANSTVKPVVTITPVNDDTYEKSEAFSATISTPVNANLGTGTANAKIVDETTPGEPPEEGDKPTVNLVATHDTAVEGEVGSAVEFEVSQTNQSNFATTVQFKLDLGELEIADIASITYTDATGATITVTDIADFVANGVLLTIPANSTVKPVVTITPVNDDTYEKSEAFSATISTPVNANLGTGTANAKIVDETIPGEPPEEGDKPTVNLVATHDTAVEGEVGSAVEFEVSQTNPSNFATSVQFKLDLGELEIADIASITYTDATGATITVTDITDFVANGVALTIPANSTVKPVVTITPVNDDTYEKSEAFSATISTPVNADLGTSNANAKIVDETIPGEPPEEGDKPTVKIIATDDNAIEGSANNTIVFNVSQDNLSNFDTKVDVKLDLGSVETADIASISYVDSSGASIELTTAAQINAFVVSGAELLISSGSNTTAPIIIKIIDDDEAELQETLSMSISNAVNADVSATANSALGYIIDNDDTTLEINPTAANNNINVGEGDDAVFTVTIGKAAANSSITLTLADGTALDTDYFDSANAGVFQYSTDGVTWHNVTGAIPVAAGNSTLLVKTDTIDDSNDESNELFSLNASLSSNGQVLTAIGTATIIDNDDASIDIVARDVFVVEGEDAVFEVSISGAAENSTLTLTLADGTALDADYFDSANAGFFQYSTDDGTSWTTISGAIPIKEGDTALLVRTDTILDGESEPNETFSLKGVLSSLNVDYAAEGAATIHDNTPTVKVGQPDTGTGDVTVPEGTEAVFGIKIENAAAGSTLTLSMTSGTADIGVDFSTGTYEYRLAPTGNWTTVPNNGQIPVTTAGDSLYQVRTNTVSDNSLEGNENFTLSGSLTSGGQTVSDTAIGTITDGPVISVGPEVGTGDVSVPEGTDAVFSINVDNAEVGSTLALTLSSGTADLGVDFSTGTYQYRLGTTGNWETVPATGEISVSTAGSSTYYVRINTVSDGELEGSENFTLGASLSSGGQAVSDSALGIITDGPVISVGPEVGTGDVSVPEGTDAVFSINVDNAEVGSTLALTLSSGTADLGVDFSTGTYQYRLGTTGNWETVPATGEISVSTAGSSTYYVRINTVSDNTAEGNENFTLSGSLTSGGQTVSDTAIGTITDGPVIKVGDPATGTGDVTVAEGTDAVFGIKIENAAANSTLTLSMTSGTADVGVDFSTGTYQYRLAPTGIWNTVPSNGEITVTTAGDSWYQIRTNTVSDNTAEGNENFTLSGSLTSGGQTVSDTAIGTITDGPVIKVGDPATATGDITVLEGADAVFGVKIENAAANSTLTLTLADGTALDVDYFADPLNGGKFDYSTDNGANWIPITGPILLSAANSSLLVRTDTIDDSIDENNELFSLNASLVSNGQTLTATGTATIIDNDDTTLEINPTAANNNINVGEGDDAVFTVTIGEAAENSTITLTLADGTALDTDYFDSANAGVFQYSTDGVTWHNVTGAIPVAAGNSTLFVKTDTIDDSIDENNELFSLNASLVSNGQTLTATGTATIIDNDDTTLEINPTAANNNINVGEGDDAVFTVTIGEAAENSSITLTLADGTALDTDYFDSANAGVFQYSTDGVTWHNVTGAIPVAAGNSTLFVKTDTIDDSIDENNELFSLNASLVSNGQTLTATGTATIIDNDDTTLEINPTAANNNINVGEGDDAVFTVTIGEAAENSSITLTLADGTALDTDYFDSANAGVFQYSTDGVTWHNVTGAIPVAAGNSTLFVKTDTIDDSIDENNELFSLNASLVSNGQTLTATGTATIIDNDDTTLEINPTAANNNINVGEGDDAVFTVTIGEAAENSTITLTLADGTALDTDYFDSANAGVFQYSTDGVTWHNVTGAIPVAAGNSTLFVKTDTIDDSIDENNELFSLNASLVSNGQTLTATGTATIIDNDDTTLEINPTAANNNINVGEGDDAVFTVTIGEAAENSTITLTLADGTALDTDYFDSANAGVFQYSTDGVTWHNVTGAIPVAAGNSTLFVKTDTIDDSIDENNELFSLNASLVSNGQTLTATGTATIIDNDDTTLEINPTAANNNINVGEGDDAVFTVTIGEAAENSTITLTLADGTALDTDYFDSANAGVFQYSTDGVTWHNVTGAIPVAAGNSTLFVKTDTIDDSIDENNELFSLNASLVSNGQTLTATGTATIIDNDDTTLEINPTAANNNINVGEGDDAVFTVTIGEAAENSTITLTLADGTALDTDYFDSANAGVFQYSTDGVTWHNVTGAIPVAAGNSTLFVKTDTIDDSIDENNELFSLNASLVSNGQTLTATGTATIIDNDDTTLEINPTAANNNINVGEGDDAVFTVTIGEAAENSTITLTLADGTALDTDYFDSANAGVFQYSTDGVTWHNVTGAIPVAAGNSTLFVKTDTIDDSIDENNELFSLNASLVSNGQTLTATGTATIIDNDDTTLEINPTAANNNINVGEGDDAVFTVTIGEAAENSSITLTLADGTALDTDYFDSANAGVFQYSTDGVTWHNVTGAIPVAAGNSTLFVKTDTIDDSIDENNELFSLNASLVSNGQTLTATGTATIIDNDDTTLEINPTAANNNINVGEGDDAVFTVTIGEAAENSSITLTLADGTALDTDYFDSANAGVFQYSTDGVTWHNVTGAIPVAAGNSTLFVKTDTIDDSIDENNELFSLNASLVSNGQTLTATGTATIIDNDDTTLEINPTAANNNINVGEGDDAVFTVTIGEAAENSTITLTLADGTALDTDYFDSANAGVFQYSTDGVTWHNVTGAIPVAAGNSTLFVKTDTIDDSIDENNELFSLNASLVSNGQTLTATGTATIIDNDDTTLEINPTAANNNINVGEGDDAVFTVTIGEAAENSTITLTLADGTALDTDYFDSANAGVFQYSTDGVTWHNVTGAIPVAAGNSTLFVKTDTIDDSIDENNELFSLNASLVSNGQTLTATGTATIIDNDDSPHNLTGTNAVISEEGLTDGIKDTDGNPGDTTDSVSATGTLSFVDVGEINGDNFNFALTGPDGISSGGEDVVWQWDANTGVLTGTTETSNEIVATVTLGTVTSANGQHSVGYTVQLVGPLDHEQGQQENVLDLEFGYSVNDGANQSQTANFVVKVEDDMPSAVDSVQSITVPSVNTNLMIALDLSGSMRVDSGVNDLTRLELALQSLESLVQKYDDLGDVRVRIVTFATTADKQGDVWVTAEDALNYLESLKDHYSNGWTNYDAALSVMQDAFDDNGALSNAQNVSYFVSDGAPTASDGDTDALANTPPQTNGDNPDHGIQVTEEATWTNFLNANHINSIAFGMGGNVSGTELNPIAYNGSNHNNGDTDAVIVVDLNQLEPVLDGSIVIPPYSGNLLGSGGFGADGGHIQDVTVKMDVNGVDTLVKFTYDADANQITNDAGLPVISGSQLDVTTTIPANFSLNMTDGSYSYKLTSAGTGAADDAFGFTLTDNDGDTSSATVTMHIEAPVVPLVGQSIGTNVLIMLDVSGSMDYSFNNTTRLEAAKSALADMLNKYSDLGEVKVQLATFDYEQQLLSSSWMTIDEALIKLSSIGDPDGGTNYDVAVEGMKAAFNTDGKLLNAKNVSYFLSDGEPHESYVIDAAEQSAWEAFVDTNNIKSHAVAIADDAEVLYLEPIAYDGEAGAELAAIMPSSLAELSAELVGSVVAPGHIYTGTALADLIVSGLGEDFMTGNGGADIFDFNLDNFNPNVVETDTIEDFNVAEGDKLDLSDLLSGESASNLDNYLNFESQGGDTLVHINKDGNFGSGGQVDQTILLKGVDLMNGGLNDQQVINELLSNGSLIID